MFLFCVLSVCAGRVAISAKAFQRLMNLRHLGGKSFPIHPATRTTYVCTMHAHMGDRLVPGPISFFGLFCHKVVVRKKNSIFNENYFTQTEKGILRMNDEGCSTYLFLSPFSPAFVFFFPCVFVSSFFRLVFANKVRCHK